MLNDNQRKMNRREVIKNRFYILSTFILLLFVFICLLCLKNLYVKFMEIETISLLWAIVGFAFTIYCFFNKSISDSIELYKKFEAVLNEEDKDLFIDIKSHFKIRRMEAAKSVLPALINLSIIFLTILTVYVLAIPEIYNCAKIIINILSSISIILVFSLIHLLTHLGTCNFNIFNCINKETYKKINESLNKLLEWKNEELIKDFIDKRTMEADNTKLE